MVSTVGRSNSLHQPSIPTATRRPLRSNSVDTLHGDPDLLIKEYFRSSPEQRAAARQTLASRFCSFKAIPIVLDWASQPNVNDAFDGAVDLLAECHDIALFKDAYEYLLALSRLFSDAKNAKKIAQCEQYWEVFVMGIGCAYHLAASERLRLLQKIATASVFLPLLNRRSIKACIIDALENIADADGDRQWIEQYFQWLTKNDPDAYIQNYATEALSNLD
jgi:hypothetical protein